VRTAVDRCHDLLRRYVGPGQRCIDATAGRGRDTLLLAELVGAGGAVLAVDLQLEAIQATGARLAEARAGQEAERQREPGEAGALEATAGPSRIEVPRGFAAVQLLHANHAQLLELAGPSWWGTTQALVFNLGYLPGADKRVITRPESTLLALEAAPRLLAPGGVLAIVVYPGHPGGAEEALAVERWLGTATERYFRWLTETDRADGTYPPTAPRLLAVERHSAPLLERFPVSDPLS
jgi:SAM-dependent methyltransferase